MTGSIAAVVAWCAANVPRTAENFGRPVSDSELEEAGARDWPDDLRELYSVVNGAPGLLSWHELRDLETMVRERARSVEHLGFQKDAPADADDEPLYNGYSRRQIHDQGWDPNEAPVDENGVEVAITWDIEAEYERLGHLMEAFNAPRRTRPRRPQSYAAGSSYGDEFSTHFIPFAGLDANHLIVDLRKGRARGCVMEWDKVEGVSGGMIWPSLEAMFAELLVSLETGSPFLGGTPIVNEGVLDWD